MTTPDAPSPFLTDIPMQFAWDSTSLGYRNTCPRLYQYIMIEGWSPRDDNIHLRFGVEYHWAIENFDRLRASGTEFEDAVRSTVGELLIRTADWDPDILTKAGRYKNVDTLLQLVIDYFDFSRNDPARTHILDNGRPAVELSFKFELDWGPRSAEGVKFMLCGHLDRVAELEGSLFVIDHKTTTTTPGQYFFDNFSPNNQMTLYALAAQIVVNSPIKGVIVEAAQILLEKPNQFSRGFALRTQANLSEWIADLSSWLNLAESFATSGHWPMNDTACDKFGGCRFRDICKRSPEVRHIWLRSDFVQLPENERWNPLKPR